MNKVIKDLYRKKVCISEEKLSFKFNNLSLKILAKKFVARFVSLSQWFKDINDRIKLMYH